MSRVVVGLAVAAGLIAAPGLANAQSTCMKRADLVRQLAELYGEAPTGLGIAANGGVLEVFTSAAGDTWTIAITRPNGTSCVMTSGQSWVDVPRQNAAERGA